jgi:hypothetical protein
LNKVFTVNFSESTFFVCGCGCCVGLIRNSLVTENSKMNVLRVVFCKDYDNWLKLFDFVSLRGNGVIYGELNKKFIDYSDEFKHDLVDDCLDCD